MAALQSFDLKYKLILTPVSLAHGGENWVLSNLVYEYDNKESFNLTSAFLQIQEYEYLQDKLKKITSDSTVNKYDFSFLEPNFNLQVKQEEGKLYRVLAVYHTKINYLHGKILEDKANTKKLEFLTTKVDLDNFIKDLRAECSLLKN